MRAKVILTNLAIVALLGFACHGALKFMLGNDIVDREEVALSEAARTVDDLFRVTGYSLMMKADHLASLEATQDVWKLPEDIRIEMSDAETLLLNASEAGTTEDVEKAKEQKRAADKKAEEKLREQAFLQASALADEAFDDFEPWNKKPTLLLLTTLEGTVIARNGDPRELVGQRWDKEYPLIRWALNGRPRWDVVKFRQVIAPEQKDESGKVIQEGVYETVLLLAAAAPVYRKGKLIGSIFVGYDIDNGLMKHQSEAIGSQTALLFRVKGKDGKEFYNVYSSSFEEESRPNQLTSSLERIDGAGDGSGGDAGNLSEKMAWIHPLTEKGRSSETFDVELGDTPYKMKLSPVQEGWEFGAGDIVYTVLRNQRIAQQPLAKLWILPIATFVAAILVILLGLIVSGSVLKPIEQLEREVRHVIESGDWEYRWELKSAEVGGLSYLINQMLDEALEEEEEEEDAGGMPAGGAATEEDFMSSDEAPGSEEELAAEPEDQYYQRIYREFQQAKTRIGENPTEIPFDQFVAKLKDTESKILEKQPGRMVRFVVQIQGNKINYKPVHIP
jgi:HAMP domain-containing protein